MVTFLRIMNFPDKVQKIDTPLAKVVQVLNTKSHHTLAPIILSDIYQALTLCKAEPNVFKRCNILLHMWLVEHLRHHPRYRSHGTNKNNYIKKDEERISDYNASVGVGAWMARLRSLIANQIEWTLGCLLIREVIHICLPSKAIHY